MKSNNRNKEGEGRIVIFSREDAMYIDQNNNDEEKAAEEKAAEEKDAWRKPIHQLSKRM